MFSSFMDEFRVRLDLTLKSLIAGAILAFAGVAAFVCGLVVLFLWTLQTYGVMQAWAAVAAVFGAIALLALIMLLGASRKRRTLAREAELRLAQAQAEKKRQPDWWQDPTILLTGLQIARTIGFRRLLPILAVGAVVAGFAITRQPAGEDGAGVQPAE